jgi:hypothetical protein
MRANELMIGNFIYIKNRRVPEFVRVDRIDGCRLLCRRYDKAEAIDVSSKFCYPIPITEEWLTKNDFIKKEYLPTVEYYSYMRLIDGYYVDIQFGCSNMGDEYVNCHIDNCDRCTVASADIQYINQLQNLLNIMNIKFDIEL